MDNILRKSPNLKYKKFKLLDKNSNNEKKSPNYGETNQRFEIKVEII